MKSSTHQLLQLSDGPCSLAEQSRAFRFLYDYTNRVFHDSSLLLRSTLAAIVFDQGLPPAPGFLPCEAIQSSYKSILRFSVGMIMLTSNSFKIRTPV